MFKGFKGQNYLKIFSNDKKKLKFGVQHIGLINLVTLVNEGADKNKLWKKSWTKSVSVSKTFLFYFYLCFMSTLFQWQVLTFFWQILASKGPNSKFISLNWVPNQIFRV